MSALDRKFGKSCFKALELCIEAAKLADRDYINWCDGGEWIKIPLQEARLKRRELAPIFRASKPQGAYIKPVGSVRKVG